MTGGEPPHPPSRTPYPPWQGRGYRRRGGGPGGGGRNGWVARRQRSPPPPSPLRPRNSRGIPPKHIRHPSHPHQSQVQVNPGGYHQGPPPLSRSLQSRLRPSSRSPPRRVEGPPPRPEQHSYRGEQHPYRGEPGPPHRVESVERGNYRGNDTADQGGYRSSEYEYGPPRGPPPKPRGDVSYRTEQSSHRPSSDHPVPYRGEPGPLYRADGGSLREELDSRRSAGETHSRSESQSSYGSWFRNPAKIHKPAKMKKRRALTHGAGQSRLPGQSFMKPESPILSRIGFSQTERLNGNGRMDSSLSSTQFLSKPPPPSLHGSSVRWQSEASGRFSGIMSPRVPTQGQDIIKRGEHVSRGSNFSSVDGDVGKRTFGFRDQQTNLAQKAIGAKNEMYSGKVSDGTLGKPKVLGTRPLITARPPQERSMGKGVIGKQNLEYNNAGKGIGNGLESNAVIGFTREDRAATLRIGSPKKANGAAPMVRREMDMKAQMEGALSRPLDARLRLTAMRREGELSRAAEKKSLSTAERTGPPHGSSSHLKMTTNKGISSRESSNRIVPSAPFAKPKTKILEERPALASGLETRKDTSQGGSMTQKRPTEAPSKSTSPGTQAKLPAVRNDGTNVVTAHGKNSSVDVSVPIPSKGGKEQDMRSRGGKQPQEKGALAIAAGEAERDDSTEGKHKRKGTQNDVGNQVRTVAVSQAKTPVARKEKSEEDTERIAESGTTGVKSSNDDSNAGKGLADRDRKDEGRDAAGSASRNSTEGKSRLDAPLSCRSGLPPKEKTHTKLSGKTATPLGGSKPGKVLKDANSDVRATTAVVPSKISTKAAGTDVSATSGSRRAELRSAMNSLEIPTAMPNVPPESSSVKRESTEKHNALGRKNVKVKQQPSSTDENDRLDNDADRGLLQEAPKKISRPSSLDLRAVLSSTLSLASTPIVEAIGEKTPNISRETVETPLANRTMQESSGSAKRLKRPDIDSSPRLVSSSASLPTVDEVNTEGKATPVQARHGTIPTTASPISVPASALSLLRASPRNRATGCLGETPRCVETNVAAWRQTPMSIDSGEERGKVIEYERKETNGLVQQIHQIDEEIAVVERKLAHARALRPKPTGMDTAKPMDVEQKRKEAESVTAIASLIASRADRNKRVKMKRSLHSMHCALRLVLAQNQAKASAATATLRPLCSNTERGLDAAFYKPPSNNLQLPEELCAVVAREISRQRSASREKQKKLSYEYKDLRDSWVRRLKSARDKKSKEKREAIRERDRFLVLQTKGQNARLSSRTSSGRMSTKIFPTLNVNGQSNGNADADALLAEIAVEGGTPGSRDIWSRTLAEVPDQNSSVVPCDSSSVLIEDPLLNFHASRAVNPWRFHERLIFLDKYLAYSKNFAKIATFLEHKSSRDCSYFYYLNKLDLGLKQLAKESSTLKRKGLLRAHLVNLAKKRLTCESGEYVSSHVDAFLSRSQVGSGPSAHQRAVNHLDAISSSPGMMGVGHAISEKKHVHVLHMNMMLKKRIVAENGSLDLSDIDRDAFSHAMSKFGTDWKEVASFMSLPNKSSSHYREFYRKNRRKLRLDDFDKGNYGKAGGALRSPSASFRQSPRMSPRGTPRTVPSPRSGRPSDCGELEPMVLANGNDDRSVIKKSRKHNSPIIHSPHSQHASLNEGGKKQDPERVTLNAVDGESRKNKTTTWTQEEGETFKQLFRRYGRDWKRIAQLMAPKTATQVKGYWRTVAHEVGNGLASESARKRKSRRSTSSEGLQAQAQHSRNDEELKPSPRERDVSINTTKAIINDTLNERKSQVGKGQGEHDGNDGGVHDGGRGAQSQFGKKFAKTAHGETRDQDNTVRSEAPKNEDLAFGTGDARRTDGVQRERRTGLGEAVQHGNESRERPMGKTPMLRSAPIPILRSVPMQKRADRLSTTAGSPLSGRAGIAGAGLQKSGPLGAGGASSREPTDRDGKGAETCDLLELVGSRLSNAAESRRGRQ